MLRFALGMAQMFVATTAAVLLIETGINPYTVTAAGLASALTVTSIVWLRLRRR